MDTDHTIGTVHGKREGLTKGKTHRFMGAVVAATYLGTFSILIRVR